jgi:hypothetical protein
VRILLTSNNVQCSMFNVQCSMFNVRNDRFSRQFVSDSFVTDHEILYMFVYPAVSNLIVYIAVKWNSIILLSNQVHIFLNICVNHITC